MLGNQFIVPFVMIISTKAGSFRSSRFPEDAIDQLPKIYQMDNYLLCQKSQSDYCQVDLKLLPKDANSFIWRTIEDTFRDKTYYNHNIIHRLLCIPKDKYNDTDARINYAEHAVSKEMKMYNLTSIVTHIQCMHKDTEMSIFDYIIMVFVPLYAILILFSTLYERHRLKISDEHISHKYDRYILAFSLISSWRTLSSTKNSKDFNMLKSIQGIRFYNTLLVIWFHTKLSFGHIFLSNTEWMEDLRFLKLAYLLDVFIVQTYFMVSAWLLANQIYGIYKTKFDFTLKDCFIILLNRLLRFAPTLIINVLLMGSSLTSAFNSPLTFEQSGLVKQSCLKNWWYTCLQINNLLPFYEVCNPGAWYLTVDTQFYLVGIILLYLILKFRIPFNVLLGVMTSLSCIIYGVIIYINDQDIIFRLNPENSKRQNFHFSTTLQLLYLSVYSSWTSSLIGIWFGIIYYKNKTKPVKSNSTLSKSWVTLFLLLPIFVLLVAKNEYEGISAAIIGPILKPTFTLGIAIGIYAMSKAYTNIVRRICEWEFAVFMANFTFSTYIYHFGIVFARGSGSYELMPIGTYELFQGFIIDASLSFIIGIITTVAIEQPWANLQRIVVPQIKKCS